MRDPEFLATVKKRLLREKNQLLVRREIIQCAAGVNTFNEDEDLSEIGDSANDLEMKEWRVTTYDDIERSLAAIDHALQRIAEGTYGLSEESGQPIDPARLLAIPTATRTVREQEAYERQQAQAVA